MGTAVLRPHDCIRGRFTDESIAMITPLRSRRNPNIPILGPKPDPNGFQSRRRKRCPVGFQLSPQDRDHTRSRGGGMVEKAPASNLVMGKVKILKRGESLSLSTAKSHRGSGVVVAAAVAGENRKPRAAAAKVEDVDLVLGSTNRLGPDPEIVMKQVRVSKCKVVDGLYAGSGAFFSSPPASSLPLPGFLGKKDGATSDLRRLLQLDLA
ncbi:hypothetical protein PanWU01x14_105050 [Parasponia andersonii]|uniref:Uncharacterized protein n=1 Tax=Parasponia andersonii TaxID=3476 RepID=A0A2P5D1E1_PARAD|nr:hypothetical protein PanWU01x14_105050 [Parasponia andersonii]